MRIEKQELWGRGGGVTEGNEGCFLDAEMEFSDGPRPRPIAMKR